VMAAVPMLTPVTCGCTAGVVCPAVMVTLAGEIVTLDGVPLVSDTVMSVCAASGRVTANVADCPSPTEAPDGSTIAPALCTVTLAVASGMLGEELAWITELPKASAVTGTATVVAPSVNVTVGGTVATAWFDELRLIVTPPDGAGAESVSVRFCVPSPLIVTSCGVKLTVAVTDASAEAGVYAGAEALMFAVPRPTPVTIGWDAGVVCPAPMVTVDGEIVTFEASLLFRVTVTPEGVAVESETANTADCPSPTVTLEVRLIPPSVVTVTFAVVSARLGALAWITAVPRDTPVTGTVTLLAPAAKETLNGTVATPGLAELSPTVRPEAGAGPDKFRVKSCVVNPVIVRFCCAKLRALTCTGALLCV